MPGGTSDGVITSSPPIFRPHLIQPGMDSIPSSSTSQECSQLTNLVKLYSESRESLTNNELISHEARLIRLVASMIREEIGGEEELSVWLSLMGINEKECSHMKEMKIVNDLHSLINLDESQLEEICRRLGLNEDTRRRVARSTNKIRTLLHSDQGQSSSSGPTDIRDDQLSWSIASPSADPSSSSPSPSTLGALQGRSRGAVESSPSTSSGMAKVAFMKPSSSRCTSTSSGREASSSLTSSTLCPPSPLNLTTTTATAASPGAVPPGRLRGITQSTTMHFGTTSGTRSPKASRFHHEIPHVWARKSTFSRFSDLCALCQRPLGFGFLNSLEKCKSCKMKVHTHCKCHAGNTCGLTPDHLRSLFDTLVQHGNADTWGMGPQSANVMAASRSLHEPAFQYPDNAAVLDSSSSTNSSTPSTPAMANVGAQHSPFVPGMCRSAVASDRGKFFTFPDSVPEVPDIVLHASTDDSSEIREGETRSGVSIALTGSQDSQSTIKQSSEDAQVVDSQGSNGDGSIAAELSPGGHTWDRNKWNNFTIRGPSAQASWTEVTIPLAKIEFRKNKLIGNGRFGSVMRGYHYGEVAVKFLNMDHVEDEDRLEHFKAEVAAFKNTRHDNIVLCLGYCLEESNLGIVMGMCKGRSLHSILHGPNPERVDMAAAIKFATEICQGISYLHQKKIIHRDLRSKNIFIESKQKVSLQLHKAVITDLGFFSMQRLRYPQRNNSMLTPKHWLAYLAPELIREVAGDFRELSFSQQSDVFSFGTIWYELITASMPFESVHPDNVIFDVGRGITAPLHNVATIREVKDILMRCWSYNPSDRPSFLTCNTLLNNLPKKRLDRSPSYPMVRSYESIF